MAYSLRFAAVFWRQSDRDDADVPAPSWVFAAPVYVLGALTIAAGLLPGAVIGELVDSAAGGVLGIEATSKLALWHGVNSALVLSLVTIACGVLLWRATEPFVRATGRVAPPVDGHRVFQLGLDGLFDLARGTTTRIQTGSLPRYVAIILVVVVGGPAVLAGATLTFPDLADPTTVPVQLVLALFIAGAALATVFVPRRLGAIVVLGAVGYGMAGLFVAHGAPDLALTQFAIETLTIVAFVLVLRQLPARFGRPDDRAGRGRRIAVAAAIGAGAFVLILAVSGEDPATPASDLAIEQAVPEAGGRNVVNVVLVDFRGLDTLGEISVLLVAAVGVTTLARVGRRPPRTGLAPLPAQDPNDPALTDKEARR